jgi:tetratricopeptide (TPR) repeat protein
MNDMSGPADAEPLRIALEELPEEACALRAEILSTLAEHAWSTSDAEAAESYAVAALELTDPDRDHLLRAEISINLGLARQQALRIEEALATWRLGAMHGRRANDLSSTARCLQRVHLALYVTGRLDDALRAGEEVAGMNRVLQLAGEAAITSGVRASVAAVRGDYAAVEAYAGEALDLVRRAKYPWAMMVSAPVLAYARALRGDAAGAHRAIDLLVDPKITFTDTQHFAGVAWSSRWLVDHYVGNPLRISPGERDLLAESVAQAKPDWMGLAAACLAVEVADACQEARIAALARRLVERAEQQGAAFTASWPFFLPRVLGLAATLEGAFDLAERKLESGVELARRIGALPELGRSRLDLARMLALRNDEGDRERALGEARASLEALARCGENIFVSRAEKLCAYLGG